MKLSGGYYLEADAHNFILLYDKGKGPKTIGYYSTMSGVMRAVLRHAMREEVIQTVCDTDAVAMLSGKLDTLETLILDCSKRVEELTPAALKVYESRKTEKQVKQKASEIDSTATANVDNI